MCKKNPACFQLVIFNYSIKKQLEISKIRGHFILNTKYIDFFYASISKKKDVTRKTFHFDRIIKWI